MKFPFLYRNQGPSPHGPEVHLNSLGHFLLHTSQKTLPFQDGIAADQSVREHYWKEKAASIIDPDLNHCMQNPESMDLENDSLARYGMPAKTYETWGHSVQQPLIDAIYSGTSVPRQQLLDYLANARSKLAHRAAEFVADVKHLPVQATKSRLKTESFGTERRKKLFTPLGSSGPYAPYSQRAFELIREGARTPVFKKTGHLSFDEQTLRLTKSTMHQEFELDTFALVYSMSVGKLRVRTTETHLNTNSLIKHRIAIPTNMNTHWEKNLPEQFWLHSRIKNIPYLETLCNQCYESIVDETHQPLDLIQKILKLHYLESHSCKFARGSAAINNWQTQSLLSAYGAGEINMPSDLVCIALAHNQFSDFVQVVDKKYPEFKAIVSKLRQPETLSIQLCNAIKKSDQNTIYRLLAELEPQELMQIRSPSGLSLMQLAAKYDNAEMITQLTRVNIPATHSHDERSPLMLAAQNSAMRSMHLLVEQLQPHEIEPMTRGKNHPLHYLVIADHPVPELLIVSNNLCMKLARNNQNLLRSDSRGKSASKLAESLDRPQLAEIIETHASRFPMLEGPDNP